MRNRAYVTADFDDEYGMWEIELTLDGCMYEQGYAFTASEKNNIVRRYQAQADEFNREEKK